MTCSGFCRGSASSSCVFDACLGPQALPPIAAALGVPICTAAAQMQRYVWSRGQSGSSWSALYTSIMTLNVTSQRNFDATQHVQRAAIPLRCRAKSRSVIASKGALFGKTFSSRPRSNAERSGAGYLRPWAIAPMAPCG